MARDDEDDDPRPKRRKPARDEDDEDDFDDDLERDLPRRGEGPKRSGAVTAVGVLGIVLGSLNLLGGLCIIGCGAGLPALQGFMGDMARKGNDPALAQAAQDLSNIPAWLLIVEGVLGSLIGAGKLVGGIGTLRRSNGARLLLLAMAAAGVVVAILDTGMTAAVGLSDPQTVAQSVIGIVIQIAFAAFAFAVLLKAENVREFR